MNCLEKCLFVGDLFSKYSDALQVCNIKHVKYKVDSDASCKV